MKNKKYDDDSQNEKIINSSKILPMYKVKKIDDIPERKSTFKKLKISKRFSNLVSNEEESEKNEDSIYSTSSGYKYIVVVTITLDGNLSTFESHKIADSLENDIKKLDKISHVIVHVNPI